MQDKIEEMTFDKLMICAKTGKEAAEWGPTFKKEKFLSKFTSVSSHAMSNRFQAVVVIATTQDDIEILYDTLVRFEQCPIVVFIGDIAVPENFPNSRLFKVSKVADCVKLLHTKIKEIK